MSVIDEARAGDARFQMGWNLPQPRARLLTFCEVRLAHQRVIVKDHHDLTTGRRTARVPAFLRAVAAGLVARDHPIEGVPPSGDGVGWREDPIDVNRRVVRAGPTELAWHPGERRADGGWAIWLRVRHGGQEVYGQRRYGARGCRRGPDHERELAEALEQGVLLALAGGMALMEPGALASHLGRWKDADGALTGFERAAAEREEDGFLERWVAAELRNALHQFGDVLARDASLADVERALAQRARGAGG